MTRLLSMIPMPKTPSGATTFCTIAIALTAAASANIVYGMQGGDLTIPRAMWTFVGLGASWVLIYVAKCHSLILPSMPKRAPEPLVHDVTDLVTEPDEVLIRTPFRKKGDEGA